MIILYFHFYGGIFIITSAAGFIFALGLGLLHIELSLTRVELEKDVHICAH